MDHNITSTSTAPTTTTNTELSSNKAVGGAKLRRQLSRRLKMHAPSSIQVESPPSGAAATAGWNVAIPLLSPLDLVAIPSVEDGEDRTAEDAARRGSADEPSQWRAWEHPAAPFYYEPVAGNKPRLFLPNCA